MKPTTLLVSLSKVDGFVILALNIVLDLRATTFSSIYTATNATVSVLLQSAYIAALLF